MKKGKLLIIAFILVAAAFLVFQIIFIYSVMFSEIRNAEEENSLIINVENQENIEEYLPIRNGALDSGKVSFSCNVDWGEEIIPDMLKILRDNNIKITFFVSGKWAENNPDLLRDMYMEGHEIQSHGYSHKLCSQVSVETTKEEILKTEAAILKILGIKTSLFAPPSGDFDDTTVELCRDLGYRIVLWSADTIDWRQGSTASIIKDRILKKNLNGGIVLMHPKEETVKALPDMISEIKKRDLEIVPLYRLPL